MIVTTSEDGTARLWEAASGRLLAILRHGNQVYDAEFSADGSLLVTASEDHLVRIWNLTSPGNLPIELSHDSWVLQASYSPDSTRVATEEDDQKVRIWDAFTGMCLLSLQPQGPDLKMSGDVSAFFSPGGRRLLTLGGIWDMDTGKALKLFSKATVEFSSTGKKLVMGQYGSEGLPAFILDTSTGKKISPPLGDGRYINWTSLSPDEKFVATADDYGDVRIWDVSTGQLACPLLHHQRRLLYLSFSPDSSKLATAGSDETVRMWSVKSGQQVIPPLKHHDQTMCASFSPDGKLIATASWDKTARIWNASNGQPVTPPLRHRYKTYQVVFSPDCRFLLTASGSDRMDADGEARLWDVATGEMAAPPLRGLTIFESPDVVFSPDGSHVLTTSGRAVRIWSLRKEDRPLEDSLLLAQVISSHTMDSSGSPVPLDMGILNATFQQLRAKYPEDFALMQSDVVKWHERQAAAREKDEDWFGTRFHLDRLIEARPEDASLRERRSHAQAELDKLKP